MSSGGLEWISSRCGFGKVDSSIFLRWSRSRLIWLIIIECDF